MAITEALGERRTVDVPAGTIEYRVRGSGTPIVLVNGAAVNGDLWRNVAPELARDHRTYTIDMPLGGHTIPLRPDADLSLYGVASIVADVLAALELHDVTLVANDTGGAVAQALVASRPERVGRLVLTSCDAFENFPPKAVAYLVPVARLRPAVWGLAQLTRLQPFLRSPLAFGWAAHARIDKRITDSYLAGVRTDPGVRRDFARLLRAADKRDTLRAAEELRRFDRPALVAWAADDKFFPVADGRRLAERLPQGRFVLVERSRTFIPEDAPGRLVELVRELAGAPRPAAVV
ncbi:MAG TPA: alpha/beta hydrolase [Solirubrobacteraceae bacterium]|nr:alpha/beta hydrolase [Solirubrobacteraceae bacterium]